jgi:hypothetical protein
MKNRALAPVALLVAALLVPTIGPASVYTPQQAASDSESAR